MLKLPLTQSGCAVNGPPGLSETATPMRKSPFLSRAGKYRKNLPSFVAASGAHICFEAHGTSFTWSARPRSFGACVMSSISKTW